MPGVFEGEQENQHDCGSVSGVDEAGGDEGKKGDGRQITWEPRRPL